MSNESQTPRTDTITMEGSASYCVTMFAEHARTLERELNEANETIATQHRLMKNAEERGVSKGKEELQSQLAQAQKERDEALAKVSLEGYRNLGRQVADALDQRDAALSKTTQLSTILKELVEALEAANEHIFVHRKGCFISTDKLVHERVAGPETGCLKCKAEESLTKAREVLKDLTLTNK